METWSDDSTGNLESKIVPIVAGTIVAAETMFRKGLKKAEKRAEQQRNAIEVRRQDGLQPATASASSICLKAVSCSVGLRISTDSGNVDPGELAAWVRWAADETDRIDPVRSGQYLSHFRPPVLDNNDW